MPNISDWHNDASVCLFVIASARNGFDPSEILFEFDGVRRDSAPSREAGPKTAPATGESPEGAGAIVGYRMVAFGEYADDETASTMKARDYKDATDLVCSVHGTQDPIVGHERAHALGRNGGQENAVLAPVAGGCLTPFLPQRARIHSDDGVAPTLSAEEGRGHGAPTIFSVSAVRRLTPVECERLMGFPDNYTQIPWRNKPAEDCPDGHRYKALGNSMAVPIMRWLCQRISSHLSR